MPPRPALHLDVMRPRDPHEPGRTATSLELFFDLVFVVAVSIAAASLHHALVEEYVGLGLRSYALVFFAIWWAWMNFTWFATSFGADDWLYRVLTFVQMGGVLVLAAGIEPAFDHHDYKVLVLSYVVMRVAMVAQWLRASRLAGVARATCLTYAGGIAGVQVVWLLILALSGAAQAVAIVLLVVAELAVPIVAERRHTTPWHPHHITERYGLFTLIVLGESLLASANAVIEAVHSDEKLGPLISLSVLTLVVTAALWWIYFWPPHHRAITSLARSLQYGYVHYVVFAAAGAFSAGVEVLIDVQTDHSELTERSASFAVSIPVALFVLGIWWIALRDNADRIVNVVVPVGALVALLDFVVPVPMLLAAVGVVVIVVTLVLHPPVVEAGAHG